MHILILGGESVRNKAWAHALREALTPLSDDIAVHEYAHWSRENGQIDLANELAAVEAKLAAHGDYIIVAKSIGGVLTAKGIDSGLLAPRKLAILGTPLSTIQREAIPYADWLAKSSAPKLFIQNHADPLGSFADLEAYLASSALAGYTVAETPGDTHSYLAFDQIRQFVADLAGQ
jgi:predicted alpha/beta-hydrolase family hydrolase